MKTKQLTNILRISLLIEYIFLIASFFIYAGVLFEYKNVCPRGENISLLTGGKIYLDQITDNMGNIVNYSVSINELNLERFLKGENQSGISK